MGKQLAEGKVNMGWDIEIRENTCETCGLSHEVGGWQLTYNLSEMVRSAGAYKIFANHSTTGPEGLEILERAVLALESDPDRFRKMNPANGWGSYDGLLKVFREMVREMKDGPQNMTIYVT